jgi:Phospholipid methyltransferase
MTTRSIPKGLVADGPFRWTRNPLYDGGILLAAGMGLLASRLGWVVMTFGLAIFYYPLCFNLVRDKSEEIIPGFIRCFAHWYISFSHSNAPGLENREAAHNIRRLCFRDFCFGIFCSAHRAFIRSRYRGSPGPVAGADLNRLTPDAGRSVSLNQADTMSASLALPTYGERSAIFSSNNGYR